MHFFSSKFKIGILGGGQLGKMLLLDSRRYDLHTKVMDPNNKAPCSNIADEFIVGNLNDYNDVINFGKLVDIITIEIENVNTDALEYLEKIGKKVYPPSKAIKIIQNKCEQKIFYKSNDLPTSAFTNYSNLANLKEDLKKGNLKFPFVWKSAKFGYDGKGVKIIDNHDDVKLINDSPCLVEEKVSIKKEISVIVSRNVDGKMKCFPVVEMEFNDNSNLVEYVMCPANISEEISKHAYEIAQKISQKLEMVGLLAVELFISDDDKILINEVAPRPHNSGHHTIECCITSQFDQHIRSILNLNPGKTDIKIPGIMVNLVGENKIEGDALYKNINHIFDLPGVNIHIYGKKKSRLNRKMGHITIVNKEISKAIEIGKKIKKKVKVTS
ncbi:MAG: 5-(carboxyamino)imidazole ribonucleotide synthase [Flavobacteriaceae bacterium]|tara:strand:+ start:321 stop:1472 length:1152 start_codon:yes stop_codon:yes gene_type:complete